MRAGEGPGQVDHEGAGQRAWNGGGHGRVGHLLLLAPAGEDKHRPYTEWSDQPSEHAVVGNLLFERPSETASDEHDHGMRVTRPPLTPTAPRTMLGDMAPTTNIRSTR